MIKWQNSKDFKAVHLSEHREKMVNTNILYCGDCLDMLKQIPDECIDLIYVDPPFYSGKPYEYIWGNHAEKRAFEDRWKGGINHYIGWMSERLEQCKRVLKKTGSMYLHCDWHAGHYLKVLMDKIFGEKNFRNEIVWHYESGGRATNFYPRKHDVIFFFSNDSNYYFNWESVGIARNKCQCCGQILKKWNNLKKHIDKDGRVYRTIKSAGKIYKYYDDEPVPPTDVWNDISHLQQKDPERLGYPTQKPEALLDRIIKASSNKNDIVLDPMVGGGTTVAVAQKLGRRWIGIDVSPTACKVTAKRLRSLGVHVLVQGMAKSTSDLKKFEPFEFQNWVCQQLQGKMSDRKSSDMGIDGWMMGTIPIQVKQSEDVGRNAIDNFETAIRRAGKKKGVFVAFSYGKGAYEEVARAKVQDTIEIILLTVEDMLKSEFNPMRLLEGK